jgi:hypothetical protein
MTAYHHPITDRAIAIRDQGLELAFAGKRSDRLALVVVPGFVPGAAPRKAMAVAMAQTRTPWACDPTRRASHATRCDASEEKREGESMAEVNGS